MITIICSNCKLKKSTEEFNKCKSTKTSFQYKCKQCEKKYRKENKDKIKIRMHNYNQQIYRKEADRLRVKKYRENPANHEKLKQRRLKYKNKEKEYKRLDHLKNPEKYRERAKKYRLNNLDKYRKYQREYAKNKRLINPHYKIEHRLRNRLLDGLKKNGYTKLDHFWDLISCTKEHLKNHLESQFVDGMNWNIFLTTNKIQIDHIKPLCSFDLSKIEDQKACFHWTNLRPLWQSDNKNKIKNDLQQSIILNNKKE